MNHGVEMDHLQGEEAEDSPNNSNERSGNNLRD